MTTEPKAKTKRKKKESPTGFRNGKLFCFNCGASFDMQLPQSTKFAADMMMSFSKSHMYCAKTWEPPVVDQSLDEGEKALWWLNGNGERGMSSDAMFYKLATASLSNVFIMAKQTLRQSAVHPSDPDDFRRCYLLLETVPEWKPRILMLRSLSPVWNTLVDHWDELTKMMETALAAPQQKAPEMYELMKKLGC